MSAPLTAALLLLLGAAPDAGSSAQWLGPKPSKLPTRVVTLAPSLTETVLSLGKGALLVGVSRFDEAPQVAKLKRVGGFNDPSIEAVVALKAELVLAQKAPANQKAVMILRGQQELKPDEVCAILAISDGNMRVLLHRARLAVRAVIDQVE